MTGAVIPEAWVEDAACASVDPELFFIDGPQGWALKRSRAKRVCGTCRVDAECLNYALETDQRHGIWGGLTEDERSALTAVTP